MATNTKVVLGEGKAPATLSVCWMVNIDSDDVSGAANIRAAEAGKRHFIESVCVTLLSGGTNWFKILDGTTEIIGPITTANGVPWVYHYRRPIYGTANTNLRIKTQSTCVIHALIEGFTDV